MVLSLRTAKLYYESWTKNHRLEYQKTFPKQDVPFIARIVFDKTIAALAGVRRAYRSLSRTAQLDPQRIGHVRTLFPFVGKVHLEVSGRMMTRSMMEHYLFVDRIESCSQPFSFMFLSALSNAVKNTGAGPAPGDAALGVSADGSGS